MNIFVFIFGPNLTFIYEKSAHADVGPRSQSAHAWRFARPPIDMSDNFPVYVSAESP